ncbi:MEF2 family protein [Pleurotus pulmonarius]
MGRRKIEIQPITHERNRSVTFLKRKNGLFKKAYELGVLCSVDVAVIIFEERPGHHLKLYQYCSTDIHDIVQRHVRYEGEKDTRGPNDFSGNAGARADDNGDGDDDDVDDDDTQDMSGRGAKRRGDGKVKPEWAKPPSTSLSDLGMGADIDYPLTQHRPLSIPQPPPISMHGNHLHQLTPSHPTSSTRDALRGGSSLPSQSASNKRPRIAPNVNVNTHAVSHSRSSSDDPHSGGAGPSSGYYPSSATSNYPQRHPSGQQSQHQFSSNYFPMTTPPPFPPFDYPPTSSSSRGPGSPASAGGGFSNARYDTSSRSMGSRPHQGQGGGSGFPGFLDADEQTRPPPNPSFKFTGLDWPVHSQNSGQSAPQPAPSSATTSSSAGPDPNSNWLDFLSSSSNSRGDIPPDMFSGGGGGPGDPSKRGRPGSGHGSDDSRKIGMKMESGKDI